MCRDSNLALCGEYDEHLSEFDDIRIRSSPSDDENATDDHNTPPYTEPFLGELSNPEPGFRESFEEQPNSEVFTVTEHHDPDIVAAWKAFDEARADEGYYRIGRIFATDDSNHLVEASGGPDRLDAPFPSGIHTAISLQPEPNFHTPILRAEVSKTDDSLERAQAQRELRLAELRGEIIRDVPDNDVYSSTGSSYSISEPYEEEYYQLKGEGYDKPGDSGVVSSVADHIRGPNQEAASSVRMPHAEDGRPAAESTRPSLLQFRPYLSEVTTAGSRCHHPSIVMRSQRINLIRASSLTNDATQPETNVERDTLTRKSSRMSESSGDMGEMGLDGGPPWTLTEDPDQVSVGNLSSRFCTLSTSRSSTLGKLTNLDLVANNRAMNESSILSHSTEPSWPGTPRPSTDLNASEFWKGASTPPSNAWSHLHMHRSTSKTVPADKIYYGCSHSMDGFLPGSDLDVHISNCRSIELPSPPPNDLDASISLSGWGQTGHNMRIETSIPPLSGPAFTSSFLYGQMAQETSQPIPNFVPQHDGHHVAANISTLTTTPEDGYISHTSPRLRSPRGSAQDLTYSTRRPVQHHNSVHSEAARSSKRVLPPGSTALQSSNFCTAELASGKKLSDPFAANKDMILFPVPPANDSPPLSPLAGLQAAIYQAKRKSRKTTGPARKATRETTTKSCITDPSLAKVRTATSSTNTAAGGVQGEGAKISRPRAPKGTRGVSRKITTPKSKSIVCDDMNVSKVPNLPENMDIDVPEPQSHSKTVSKAPPAEKKAALVKKSLSARKATPGKTSIKAKKLGRKEHSPVPVPTILSSHLATTPAEQADLSFRVPKTRIVGAKRQLDTLKMPPNTDNAISKRSDILQTSDHVYMDIDSPAFLSSPSHRTHPMSHQDSPSDPTQTTSASTTRKTTKRKATPAPTRKPKINSAGQDSVAQVSTTPESKETHVQGQRLTPDNAATRQRNIQTPLRRSPRLKGDTPGGGL